MLRNDEIVAQLFQLKDQVQNILESYTASNASSRTALGNHEVQLRELKASLSRLSDLLANVAAETRVLLEQHDQQIQKLDTVVCSAAIPTNPPLVVRTALIEAKLDGLRGGMDVLRAELINRLERFEDNLHEEISTTAANKRERDLEDRKGSWGMKIALISAISAIIAAAIALIRS